ncbi:magnesium transporter NIPA-domain-containing protein [Mycena galopus ATCC 62051]|nr:magnesium transporter NIPA-domain-containing protein [Mycena galopus ATCC 62051]
MVDDKYIGLALAVSSSAAIGTSTVITKKGLTAAADGTSASENLSYLRNPVWWAGMSTLILGEERVLTAGSPVANFAAYTFAPPVLVTPLGALSVLIGAILASFLLNERLGHLGRVGCALCLIGSVIIVLHAPDDKEIETIVDFLGYALKPGFLLYCLTVSVGAVVLAYVVVPKHGRTNPVVYISIASIVGSVSVMFVKGFGLAVKLTFAGKNQFIYPSTYVFGLISVGCILIQLNYYNKALDIFSVNIVNPMYYVGFSSATIVASLILFEGFNTTSATNTVSLLCGFIVTFLGVHILNLSMLEESAQALEDQGGVSLEGRLSLDGWHGIRRDSLTMGLPSPRGHARRSSLYRTPTSTLFNAFGIEPSTPATGEHVGLQRLQEQEDEDEWNEDADERTALRTPAEGGRPFGRSPIQGHTPNRSLGNTPTRPVRPHPLSPPALGDIRISPRPV